MKKIISTIIGVTSMMICFASLRALAAPMDMYINEQFVERDIVNRSGIDMLPIADIAGELGYEYQVADYGFVLAGPYNSYNFQMGNPVVYDYWGNWNGLDIVPMIIDGKVRIPATFVTKTLGLSYTWDYVTNTIFVNSPNALNETLTAYWYEGYKRAVHGTVANYWHSIVPDYGNISCEQPYDYYLGEDGWTYFYYEYYGSDVNIYVNYLRESGWEEIIDPYYSEDEQGYIFYRNGVAVSVYADFYGDYVEVSYTEL